VSAEQIRAAAARIPAHRQCRAVVAYLVTARHPARCAGQVTTRPRRPARRSSSRSRHDWDATATPKDRPRSPPAARCRCPAEPYSLPSANPAPARQRAEGLATTCPGNMSCRCDWRSPCRCGWNPVSKEGVATIMARTLDEGRHGIRRWSSRACWSGAGSQSVAGWASLGCRWSSTSPSGISPTRSTCCGSASPSRPSRGPGCPAVATRLAEIEQERSVASHRAAAEFCRTFFDPGARASRPVGRTADTVSAITRDAVVAFHARHVGPVEATLVVAGDLAGLDVVARWRRALGQWLDARRLPGPAHRPSALLADDRARIVVVDRPESVQTELLVGAGARPSPPGRLGALPPAGLPCSAARRRLESMRSCGRTRVTPTAFAQLPPRRRGGIFVTSGSVRADVTVRCAAAAAGRPGRRPRGLHRPRRSTTACATSR
jgi:hypothetical protein